MFCLVNMWEGRLEFVPQHKIGKLTWKLVRVLVLTCLAPKHVEPNGLGPAA